MKYFELNKLDIELLAEAIKTSDRLYLKDQQEVAASLRTSSGKIFSAIHFETKLGSTNICGEVAAICCMVAGGHRDLDTIVAVWRDPEGNHFILPPCGRCRETINEFNPNAWIIVSEIDNHWEKDAIKFPVKVKLKELLPKKWD